MRHPNPDMLLRIAQADAYGMAVEYVKLPEHQGLVEQALSVERYLAHPIHGLRPGQYTDDTQMSIAVSEVILQGDFTREQFAEAFVRAFRRDQRPGYARHFQAFLEGVQDGADFLARIRPDSDKNGAAMRSVPLGVLPDPAQVRDVAQVQARLTHDTQGGILSSQMVALMSHFALYEAAPLREVGDYLGDHLGIPPQLRAWDGSPVRGPGVGVNTARAVLQLLQQETDLLGILRTCIRWGGDTDSVAAIAWGIASARMREPLPEFLESDLEPGGRYGAAFLRALGADLMGMPRHTGPQ